MKSDSDREHPVIRGLRKRRTQYVEQMIAAHLMREVGLARILQYKVETATRVINGTLEAARKRREESQASNA